MIESLTLCDQHQLMKHSLYFILTRMSGLPPHGFGREFFLVIIVIIGSLYQYATLHPGEEVT